MAAVAVPAGSPLAEHIQNAAQAKLMEIGWAPEESDTTLSEYVTMMLVNGKDPHSVQAELGGELLGVGEDDPGVVDFTQWLFDQARGLSGQAAQSAPAQGEPQPDSAPAAAQDEAMGDAAPGPAGGDGMYVSLPSGDAAAAQEWSIKGAAGVVDTYAQRLTGDDSPSGPKAMRNGNDSGRGRGRSGRMLGQMNRQMDRAQDDPLRRIKGAASGRGRIDAHGGQAPRGPRHQNAAHGLQRAMNGGRGGHAGMAQFNPAMQQDAALAQLDPSNQMAFMQLMEMQASMMANMLQTGQAPGGAQPGFQKGGRGGNKDLFDRMDGKRGGGRGGRPPPAGGSQNGDATAAGGMDIDKPLTDTSKPPFEVMCKFNLNCLNPDCRFAHQSPANRRPNVSLDMSDTCSYGAACQNNKCIARHPSPAQRQSYNKSEVECKFYPNCSAGPMCPFKHPDVRPCRNGADCKVENCPFAHSQITCRYNPCTRPDCPYKHVEGQKRGRFEDKVWMPNKGSDGAETAERFSEFKQNENQPEELILTDQEATEHNGDAAGQNFGDHGNVIVG